MLFGIVSALTFGSLRILAFLLSVGFLLAGIVVDFLRTPEGVSKRRELSQQNPFIWLTLCYLLVVAQGLWLNGLDIDGIARSLPGGVLVMTAALASHRGLAIPPALLKLGLLAFVFSGVVLGFAGSSTNPCRSDKCSPIGALYKGGFAHENMMGFTAVLAGIVLVGSVLQRSDRRLPLLAVASFCGALAVLSGARTSLYAGVATALALGIVLLFKRWRGAAAGLVPVLCAGVGAYLIQVAQVEDFSRRGRRWMVVRDSLDDGVMSIFGNGLTAWADVQPLFNHPTSTHSLYGSVLIHGGLLALIPFALFLVVATRRAQRFGSIEIVVLLHFIAFQGIMETVWEPSVLVQRGWVVIAVAMTVPSVSAPRPQPEYPQPSYYEYLDLSDRGEHSQHATSRGSVIRGTGGLREPVTHESISS